VNITAHITGTALELDTVAGALAESADRRRRTGITAAAELERDKATLPADQLGAAALLVVDVLAEAELLDRYATALAQATVTTAQAPAPTPLDAALAAAEAAVARATGGVPSLQALADAHNAALQVDGRPAWVAPGALDDDDVDAEAALELDLAP
jgi:hypothetical protein